MSGPMLQTFSGAVQASLSVLLTIFYGVLASQFELLDTSSARRISKVAVKLFLPFLLITAIGSQFSLSNIADYGSVFLWATLTNAMSMTLGIFGRKAFNLPGWVVPAVTFNNTTSLPLLLVSSLEKTGLLEGLLAEKEGIGDAIGRAKSYFLACAVVSDCLTFAVGPRLLDDEGGDDEEEEEAQPMKPHEYEQQQRTETVQGNGQEEQEESGETTSLLPDRVNHFQSQTLHTARTTTSSILHHTRLSSIRVSPQVQNILSIVGSFFNAPLVGAVIGCAIGLTPVLHRAFFADTNDGGIFTAWLTASLKNTGELFVSLQVILVGVKLSSSLRKMKRGERTSGHMPWSATFFVFGMRYLFWPLASVLGIYALANGRILGKENGILWFSMMIMPVGPPAMSLLPMADVSGKDEEVKLCVAKLLMNMYALSPVLAFVVVGALKACENALQKR